MINSVELAASALRPDEVAFYEEHGWVISSQTIPDALIDDTLAGLEEHWSGHRDRVIDGVGRYCADWMPGAGDGTRNNEYISLQNHRISRLAWSPLVGSVAAAAARTPCIRLFDDQTVYKPGGQASAVVGWHVDGDYWQTCSSQNMVTAWIPLHDCPQEMGPLVVLDGSHKWSHRIDRSALSFHSADMGAIARFVEGLGYEFKPVVIDLKRGQFSLHHCRSIHGSHPNRSERPRIALAVHLQDDANRYRPAAHRDGRPVVLFNDRIARRNSAGEPDYQDDQVFPVLWRQEEM